MKIWIDADACPREIKEVVYRAAKRTETRVTLVANQGLQTPSSPLIDSLIVPTGLNAADQEIVARLSPGDLVVTADVPLAAEVVEKGATAIDPRGTLYTNDNVSERLAVRNLMDQLRGEMEMGGGPRAFGPKDRQAFANQLDRWLTMHRNRKTP